jgi:hypothetical protein
MTQAKLRAGELRRAEEKNVGNKFTASPTMGNAAPTNAERRQELGISKKQDEQWQKPAAEPERREPSMPIIRYWKPIFLRRPVKRCIGHAVDRGYEVEAIR